MNAGCAQSAKKDEANGGFIVRKYEDGDFFAVAKLFYDVVHSVNAADYTEEQLRAWAPAEHSLELKRDALRCQDTVVAEDDGGTIGFASLEGDCLDMLFVRGDRLRKGVASALCDVLEEGCDFVKTFASVTAKPFFEKRGYVFVKEQLSMRRGAWLLNYEMHKSKAAAEAAPAK